jgi:hypothetical protein
MRRLLPDYTRIFGPTDNPYPKGWLDQYPDAWNLLQLESGDVEQERALLQRLSEVADKHR